jgi:hypothetical protein
MDDAKAFSYSRGDGPGSGARESAQTKRVVMLLHEIPQPGAQEIGRECIPFSAPLGHWRQTRGCMRLSDRRLVQLIAIQQEAADETTLDSHHQPPLTKG